MSAQNVIAEVIKDPSTLAFQQVAVASGAITQWEICRIVGKSAGRILVDNTPKATTEALGDGPLCVAMSTVADGELVKVTFLGFVTSNADLAAGTAGDPVFLSDTAATPALSEGTLRRQIGQVTTVADDEYFFNGLNGLDAVS